MSRGRKSFFNAITVDRCFAYPYRLIKARRKTKIYNNMVLIETFLVSLSLSLSIRERERERDRERVFICYRHG